MSSKSGPRIREVDLTASLRKLREQKTALVARERNLIEKITKLERVLGIRAGADFFRFERVINPEDIPLSKELSARHPLSKFISGSKVLTGKELNLLMNRLKFEIHCYESGAIPAALNPASDYSQHAWTRDAAIIGITLAITGHKTESENVMKSLACFYSRKEQRDRFIGFHYDSDPFTKYRYGNPNLELPHIRARIDTSGSMIESDQHWSHSQLDAIGMWLLVTFAMANRHGFDLQELDSFLGTVNGDNRIDSIFSVGLRFLNRISFWNQHDHGPWEDRLEPARATSVGMCLGAMKEALQYFRTRGWNTLAVYNPPDGMQLEDEILHAFEHGTRALERRIPRNGEFAIETENFPVDSALSFLLYPFNPGLSGLQEKAILRALYKERMGEVGFTRRDHDEYVGMDYPYNQEGGVFCNIHTPGYKAAEWTLFDPLLSAYYYQRYLDSSAMDEPSFILADRHLKRTLAQVTKREDSYKKLWDGLDIHIPAGRLPEAYWYDTREEKWRANENTPLLMAEAAGALMFERALEAAKLWDLARRPVRNFKLLRRKKSRKTA